MDQITLNWTKVNLSGPNGTEVDWMDWMDQIGHKWTEVGRIDLSKLNGLKRWLG